MQNLQVSRFKSLRNTKPDFECTLLDCLLEIKSDKYKKAIDLIRAEPEPSKSKLKEKLPLFTPCGTFNHRSLVGIKEYNGIIYLDIDNIDNVLEVKELCKNIGWVLAAFITPSGRGIKIIVKTNATQETYKAVELAVAKDFFEQTGCERDRFCHDISRIHFFSYDPDIYINEDAWSFNYLTAKI